jgi:bifunctional polynucleotide phosphatase/kinase
MYCYKSQSKDWKHLQIQNAIATLDIAATICIATTKESYKPSLAIYNSLFKKEINKEKSFMCGDALGRPNDYSNSDLKFAEAMGLKIISPEEMFPFNKKNTKVIVPSHQEIVILSGYPASGKSYIAETIFKQKNYIIIDGDTHKTSKKMIKLAKEPIENGKSVVFDATNATREKRAEYIQFAKEYEISVRCIHMNTSLEEALSRNNNRDKPVPKIVYNVYNKRFQIPDSKYDMCEVIII